MPRITIEKFTSILRQKVDSGVEVFTGNRSKNKYQIHRNSKSGKWYLKVNSDKTIIRVSFDTIARNIWDLEFSH